jgi:curved DNA-binding protein CbpA
MSSPPPIDPYSALGISKDADLSTIRSAHRKLVLKFHPDRIKDEAERVKGREEFQKVQQAYELLSDPAKRSRYDDKVRLAELRKEALGRDLPVRSAAHPTRPSQFSTAREYKDGHYYEERAPKGAAFFDEDDRFQEEPYRSSARRTENFERKTSGAYTEKRSPGWKAGGISIDITLKLQKQAALAKEKIKEKESRAAAAKRKDQDRRREVSEKHTSRRAHVEEYSSSDSDTATYANVHRKPTMAPLISESAPRRSRSNQPRRKVSQYSDDDDDDWIRDKHQSLHASARDYISKAAPDRPRVMYRQDSSHSYFEPRDDRPSTRRSGSDREERHKERDRPQSSGGKGPAYPEVEVPEIRRKMPSMPTATSAPANFKIPEDRREAPQPHRSTTTQAVRDHRKEVPAFSRSQTMPSSGSTRRSDNAPSRGSNLKHAETQDSGYGSSSPATPDMNGTSPPKYVSATATRYQIVDEAQEFSSGHRTILVDPDDSHRRTRSPIRVQRPNSLSTSGRRPSRAAAAYTPRSPVEILPARPSISRHESSRPSVTTRDSHHVPKAKPTLWGEVPSDDHEIIYKTRASTEPMASPRLRGQDGNLSPVSSRRSREAARDYDPVFIHGSDSRHPGMGHRKASVY